MQGASATVGLTRYDEPDWLVLQTIEGLARQDDIRLRVLFLDQAGGPDTEALLTELNPKPNVTIERIGIPQRSLSHARNLTIERATTDTILFIDADAIPHAGWAYELTRTLGASDERVAVAGGRILLKWHTPPLAVSKSWLVSEQYSGLDFGVAEREVPKVIGASFALRKDRFPGEMRFDESLDRRGGKLFGGGDTDLCARVRSRGGKVVYNGRAIVEHQVLPHRITYRWLIKRMFYAGYGRGVLGGQPSPTHQMRGIDWMVLPLILPPYFLGVVAAHFRR